ncbi:hypothetical protein GQ464_007985 [Rhodocaloribacter litoris]|uniref:CAP domain-containing protein n=1 Tax=Rhodocaloribacter litoris TaxID=2558931 RepID=UPI0014209A1D|nr:CAP domain-containing protein [Rhodocaloribacter litoris]QXD16866.1 hypothetical protein GQ464_007985 [Rhodocaloribacter litoris]
MRTRQLFGVVLAILLGGCATLQGPRVIPAGHETASFAPEGPGMPADLVPGNPLALLLAPPAWPPEAVATAPPFDAAALERRIHERVNEVRARHGLARLDWSASLLPVARAHSEDMARRGYFAHVNPEGEDAGDRARRAGVSLVHTAASYATLGIGENLSLMHRYAEYRIYDEGTRRRYVFSWRSPDEIARQVVASWLQSPGHRANLLSPIYAAEAIGVFRAENEALFITQNLLTAR